MPKGRKTLQRDLDRLSQWAKEKHMRFSEVLDTALELQQ